MDEVDLKILKELVKCPQTRFSRIAEKVDVSLKTVQTRYKKLEEEGIILRSSVVVDLSKLGYQGKAFLQITNVPGQSKENTIVALKQMQNIILLTEIIGDFDVLAIVAVKDFRSILDLVTTIEKLPSVDQVQVSLTIDTLFPVGEAFNNLFQTEKEPDV